MYYGACKFTITDGVHAGPPSNWIISLPNFTVSVNNPLASNEMLS
jgi:hypothetical protein